jgi:hypothetical protein
MRPIRRYWIFSQSHTREGAGVTLREMSVEEIPAPGSSWQRSARFSRSEFDFFVEAQTWDFSSNGELPWTMGHRYFHLLVISIAVAGLNGTKHFLRDFFGNTARKRSVETTFVGCDLNQIKKNLIEVRS